MDGAREVAWAVTRAGFGRAQVTGDFTALVSEVVEASAGIFPRRLGYLTRTELIDDHRVRLEVRRGDFEGVVEIGCDWDHREAGRIVAIASARSQRVLAAKDTGERVIRRSRGVAVAIGILMSAGFCWLATGVQMPVLGGLMLSVMLSAITTCLLIVGGSSLGSRIGEGVASWRKLVAEQAVLGDMGVQADIRRWNSLNRRLRNHRRALTRGLGGGPFRRPMLGT